MNQEKKQYAFQQLFKNINYPPNPVNIEWKRIWPNKDDLKSDTNIFNINYEHSLPNPRHNSVWMSENDK